MKRILFKAMVVAGLSSVMALAAVSPAAAQAARQKDKNLMRNLGMALGAAAVYQAVKGEKTSAAVLGAGAVLAGKKYEDARKAQSEENNWRYGQYDNDRRYDDNYRYDDRRRSNTGNYRNDGRVRYYQQGKNEKSGYPKQRQGASKQSNCR